MQFVLEVGWNTRGRGWRGVNVSEKVRQKTRPLQSDTRAPDLSVTVSFCLISSPPRVFCLFWPAVLTPLQPFPSSLVPFSWTPYLPRLLANNTFFPHRPFFICQTLTQSLPHLSFSLSPPHSGVSWPSSPPPPARTPPEIGLCDFC